MNLEKNKNSYLINLLLKVMSELKLPNYGALLGTGPRSRPLAKRILGDLLKSGGKLHVYEREYLEKLFPGMSWKEIEAKKKSKVYNNVSVLLKNNFIEKDKRGPIWLKYKTPLCWLANTPGVSFAYLGLLGKRQYEISETETAIKLLEMDPNVGETPKKIVVVTTPEVVGEWKDGIKSNLKIDWRTFSEEELNDIDKIEEELKPIIDELMRNHILIMDLTSGPRPAGIAYYELASQLKIPLIYIYLPKKKLKWLISKEKLMREIGNVFHIESEEEKEKKTTIELTRKRVVI